MTTQQRITWTKPYCGVQHTEKTNRGRRCSVQDNNRWARLLMWFEGCGFSPRTSDHDTAEQAREAGEKWLASYE